MWVCLKGNEGFVDFGGAPDYELFCLRCFAIENYDTLEFNKIIDSDNQKLAN